MRAEALRGEKRAFDMDTEEARPAVRLCGNLAERRVKLLFGRGYEGWEVGGDSGLEQRFSRSLIAVAVRVQEVHSPETVDLDVDESRRRDSTPVSTCQSVAADAAVHDLEVARDEAPVDEGCLDAEPHWAARRTLPFASRSRATAVSASTPARSETTATFPSPPDASNAASTRSSGAPVAAATTCRRRSRSFAFAGATPTMRFPNVRPSRIIATVEMVFSTSFCAVPALSLVDPATSSGPTTTAISWSVIAASSESRTETTAAVRAPAPAAASAAPRT